MVDQGGVGSNDNLDDFRSSDAYVVTVEELDDDIIIESVSNIRVHADSTDSEQEPEEVSVKPTATKVMNSNEVLRRHTNGHSLEQALSALSTYDRHVMLNLVKEHQALLADLFTTA